MNRLQTVTDHYPLFSRADESLWLLGENYGKLGDNFEDQQVAAYQKIVSDYPMSPYVDGAKEKAQRVAARRAPDRS